MLVIRKAQIDAMLKGDEDEFLTTLISRAKADDPELTGKYDDDRLRKMARVALERSEKYGFTYAMDQIEFVAMMFKVGSQFDAEPEIKAILEDSTVPPEQKLERLRSPLVPDSVWEKVAAERDDGRWTEA